MPRIDPDSVEKDGLHWDYYWPGEVHSVWTFGFIEIRRERKYFITKSAEKKVSWQIAFNFGKRRRLGIRWETDRG